MSPIRRSLGGVRPVIHGFDWDAGNRDKCVRHGVSLEEAEQAFRDQGLAVFPDPQHSIEETRLFAIGKTEAGRHVFVVFTIRMRGGRSMIRPISVRYMHSREVERYAEEAP